MVSEKKIFLRFFSYIALYKHMTLGVANLDPRGLIGNDPWGVASLDPRGLIGRFYVGDH